MKKPSGFASPYTRRKERDILAAAGECGALGAPAVAAVGLAADVDAVRMTFAVVVVTALGSLAGNGDVRVLNDGSLNILGGLRSKAVAAGLVGDLGGTASHLDIAQAALTVLVVSAIFNGTA